MTPRARITLEGVSYSRDGREVIAKTLLDISDARIGLVGRNGSGKTTLARLLAGLVRPDSGRVLINGVDVARDRRAAIRTVGILFQNPDHQIIFPTVEEELAFGLRQLGRSKDAARDGAAAMLARFGKTHWQGRAVATLSQGQRHLVCLMSVLAMEPALIILDEPFTGLDIPTTRQMHRYLAQVGPSVLHITHDPAALAGYDRVIWMDNGAIRESGPAARTLAHYETAMMEADDAGADLLD
ncbi:energy-coupling factor ABC transporter ATP-binding protein [Primorskyibacter flagellatus]|uniref:energy-coupling factor ABC transporter ATP-binding protein n=1 Tax=Primorskyibacter flagellatus TaxID=1387277 RepID=UPI003A8E9030